MVSETRRVCTLKMSLLFSKAFTRTLVLTRIKVHSKTNKKSVYNNGLFCGAGDISAGRAEQALRPGH
jgi:hypothetical protein